jgi:hypothetical protein
VQSGGQINTVFNGPLYLYSAMTNAGVVNATFSNQPPSLVWQPIYTNTALIMLAHAPVAIPASRTNVLVNLNGTPGHQAILLTSTNATLPLANWTHLATNTFDATSYLSFTNSMRPIQPYQFFTFKLQ